MISIKVCKGIPYIWDAEDWLKLRREHRIVGVFDGAEGCGWSSPIHLHLPLRLSIVETQYLIAHGIAQTLTAPALESPHTHFDPNKVSLVKSTEKVKRLARYRRKRILDIEHYADKAIEGKHRKGKNILDKETFIQQELTKIEKADDWVEVFVKDPWVDDNDYIPFDFPLPNNHIDKLRFLVFEDFHFKKKYYVTPGVKFGGDFLAYPDDPFHHHAEFIIMCQDKNRKFQKLHLISQSRLAQTVKKTLLVAVLEEKTNSLQYFVPQQNTDNNYHVADHSQTQEEHEDTPAATQNLREVHDLN